MIRIATIILICLISLQGCVERFDPGDILGNPGYLVVEGFLNSENGTCQVKLQLTQQLNSEDAPEMISNASVSIEQEDGEIFQLNSTADGRYRIDGLSLNTSQRFRLKIAIDESSYASDFVTAKRAPSIDSVVWRAEGNFLNFYLSTHDATNQTRYYLWQSEETWQYAAGIPSQFKYVDKKIVRRQDYEQITHCWKTAREPKILIETTASLADDVVADYWIKSIDLGSAKLLTRYSVLITQYALSQDDYLYWRQLKENSQETGTLYDKQPSRITGNIKSLSHPDQPVLGYFTAGSVSQVRLFISPQEIPNVPLSEPTGYEACEADTLLLADIPNFHGNDLIGTEVRLFPSDILIGYITGYPRCVDCRLIGGDNVKPVFW